MIAVVDGVCLPRYTCSEARRNVSNAAALYILDEFDCKCVCARAWMYCLSPPNRPNHALVMYILNFVCECIYCIDPPNQAVAVAALDTDRFAASSAISTFRFQLSTERDSSISRAFSCR